MKHAHVIGALTLLLLPGVPTAQTQTPDSPEVLYERLAPSIVMIGTLNAKRQVIGLGSGVVIGRGQVITNCHVLRKATSVYIISGDATYRATLRYPDPERDLCQLESRDLNLPAVEIGSVTQIRIGQRVYALGNPRGLERTLSDGLVSALRGASDAQNVERIQTTAPIAPGSSGGGLFDAWGRLVGITTSGFRDAGNIAFAVPADWIAELPARAAEQLARFRSSAPGQNRAETASVQTAGKPLNSAELSKVFGVYREMRISAPSGLQKLTFQGDGNVRAEFLSYPRQIGRQELRSSDDHMCLTFFVGNRNFNMVLAYLNDCFKVQQTADRTYQFTTTDGKFTFIGEI